MKPKLLVLELWGLGDLIIATPFLRAATEAYDVTLVAKPYARDLQPHFWPAVNVVDFIAPWTAFTGKYRLARWPWRALHAVRKELRAKAFEFGISARWDPRDHWLLAQSGAQTRLGFPRMGSRFWLNQPLERPGPRAHRSEYWRMLSTPLGIDLPASTSAQVVRSGAEILVHTGAGQSIRVWSLERYRGIVARLRAGGHRVQVACDLGQKSWWQHVGETAVAAPATVADLLALIGRARAFIGNDSGPGHLAGLAGVPTYTIFGPQLPEWFAPANPASAWMEGKPCPFKPCADYCRFSEPLCLTRLSESEVWTGIEAFLRKLEFT